jgi:predicted TIM-barrel fold metal-dependent hydrolase
MMIIDAHSHWLPQEIINSAHFYSKAWGDIETQLKAMDEAGVDRAVLSYPTSDAFVRLGGLREVAEAYNGRVAEVLRRYPDRFIGAAVLAVDDKKGMVDAYKKATAEQGFRAVSLATSTNGIFLDDPQYFDLYALAQDDGVPIFVHPQIVKPIGSEKVEDPLLTPVIEYVFETTMCVGKLLVSQLFERFPKLNFIFAYFGGVTPFIAHRYDTTYTMLRGVNFVRDLGDLPSAYLKRIYVDTSGDRTLANYISSLELFGAGHIVWGSDYPAKKDIKGSMGILRDVGITEKDCQDILGGTLERIFQEVKL